MEVKKEFTQTEIGSFPKDWETKPLKFLSSFITKGATPTTYGYGWEKEGVLFLRSECVSEDGLDLSQSMYISLKAHNALIRGEVHSGDILMTITGNVGRFILLGNEFGFANTNQHIARIRIIDSNAYAEYVYHFLSQPSVRKYYNSITTGQAYPQTSLTQVRDTEIPLPPLPEQHAIASALSDVDSLLTALDSLIAKKRLVKQGAMQELLTGKRRLSGFSGEWKTKKIGDLLGYEQPGKYIVRNTEYNENSGTPVLTAGKSFILGYPDEEEGIYRNLPVIVFDDFTIASKYVDFPFKVKSSAIKLLKTKNENSDLRFMFERMQIVNFETGDHKRYFISEYQNIEIEIPPFPEQQAIAEILSDMDAEINALERRREKTRQLKAGMMQELLTGRIRLL